MNEGDYFSDISFLDEVEDEPEKEKDLNKLFKKEDIDLVLFINDTEEPERLKWMKQKYPNLVDLKFSPNVENNFNVESKNEVREEIIKRLTDIKENPINIRLCATCYTGDTFDEDNVENNTDYIIELLNFISKNTKEDQVINFELKYYTCRGAGNFPFQSFEAIIKQSSVDLNKVNINVKSTYEIAEQGKKYKYLNRVGGPLSTKVSPEIKKNIFKIWKKNKLRRVQNDLR